MSKESAMPTNDAKKRKALVDDVRKRNKKDKNPEVRNRKVTHMDDYLAQMGPDNVKKALASIDREDRKTGHTRFKKEQSEKQRKAATAPLNSKQRDKLMADLEVAGGSYKEIEPSEETTMASKKKGTKVSDKKSKKTKGKAASTGKTDAVDAAGAKAKDAVDAAKDRNPIVQPASEGDKQGPPSPAGSKDNTGYGTSTQRTPKPSSKDSAPASTDDDGTPFDGDAYAKSEEGKARRAEGMAKAKNKTPLRAAEDADARAGSPSGRADRAAQQWKQKRLRAGAEGTSGKSGPLFRQNDTTTEMPATGNYSDEARTARIKELANKNRYNESDGINKDPNSKGEMPDDPRPRSKPTVLTTPTKDGEMPKADKPGFMSRLRSRIGSFTSRPGAPAAPAAPPTPPTPPSGSGGGATPPTPPSGGGYVPADEPAVTQSQDTKNGKQTQTAPAGASINFAPQIGGDDNSVGKGASGGGQITGRDSAGRDFVKGNTHNQKINAGYGPVTATTSGRATSSGKGGVTASTTGTASSHPRAQNASRGGRPTSRKK